MANIQLLKIESNFLVLTDQVTGEEFDYPLNQFRAEYRFNIVFFILTSTTKRDSNIRSYEVDELLDPEGNPFADMDAIKAWLRENTGSSSSESIPKEYNKQTASGESFTIQKGILNNLRLRPQIMNEHAESSRNIQNVVSDGNIVGQVFKASQDNINGINLTMQSASNEILDDFESYVDNAALQAIWVETGIATPTPALLNETIVYEGDQSMYLTTGDDDTGTEWKRIFAATDFTGYIGQFRMFSNKEYKDVKMRIFVEDSVGNTNSAEIFTIDKNAWYQYIFQLESLTPDGVTAVDFTDIVSIGFRVEKHKRDGYVVIDIMVSVPPPGSVEVKLWDMGTSLPNGVSLDSGTQYEKLGDLGITGKQESSVLVDLLGGKRMYHIDEFIAGTSLEIPTNELLIPNHYYAITLHYVDTDVSVYGPNELWNDYYVNGYAFNTVSEAANIVALGSQIDLMFVIFSTQDVYVYEVTVATDGTPGVNSETTVYIEDEYMKRTDVLVSGIRAVPTITTQLRKPFYMSKGSKFEEEYNDDFSDDVNNINLIFQYLFIPQVVNG